MELDIKLVLLGAVAGALIAYWMASKAGARA